MPYEEYLNQIHERNHRLVAQKRQMLCRVRKEKERERRDTAMCIVFGTLFFLLMYGFVGWGGMYR